MLKIGITGGIGSGKSTVCQVFKLLGVPVYNSDEESKLLLNNNPSVKSKIIETFGSAILTDGLIDRKKLGAVVFNNADELKKLNAIVHPAVGEHFQEWLKLQQHANYILKEAAILFESDAYKQVDKVITVIAPTDLKIQRVTKRDNVTTEEVMKRMNKQLPDEEKIKRSQFVIYNDEQQLVIPQVLQLHQVLSQKI